MQRVIVWSATLVLAAGWFAFLRPTIWGGPVTYIVIRGTSMLPTYQPGDLVIVQREDDYGPGDVVAYRVPDEEIGANLILIHRIVEGSGTEGFVLLGDNNDEEDVWYPTEPEIVGRPLFDIPRVGLVLTFLRAPLALASLAAGAAVALVTVPKSSTDRASKTSPRHRRRRHMWKLNIATRRGAHVA